MKIPASILLIAVCVVRAGDTRRAPDAVIFSHQVHVGDQGMECAACHTPLDSSQGRDTVCHTAMKACSDCHDEWISGKDCIKCHTNPDAAAPMPAKRQVIFSHREHMARQVSCRECHGDVAKAQTVAAIDTPHMAACLTCHDNARASKACGVCHEDPSALQPPASHEAPRFAQREHGRQARMNGTSCRDCHQPNFCDRCHSGQLVTDVHEPDYALTHGPDARRRVQRCTTCHDARQFCAACHEERR